MTDSVKRFDTREEIEFGDLRYSFYFKSDRVTSGIGVLPPSGKGGLDEGHEGAEEVFAVVKGELIVVLPDSDERYTLAIGDAIIISPGAPHIVENHSNKETIFTFNISPGLKGI